MILAKQCTRRGAERTFGDASDSICSIIELPFRSFGLFAAPRRRKLARRREAPLPTCKKRNQIKRY